MGPAPTVTRLGDEDLDSVVAVLSDAFEGYPVMRHVLEGSRDYREDLAVLLRFFATARVLRSEPILGAAFGGAPAGVALVSFPDAPSPPALAPRRAGVWETLGSRARARYERFGEATSGFFGGLARVHLNLIGVRKIAQGRGVGRALLEAVAELARDRFAHHHLTRDHAAADGVTLTTEEPSNVDLYRRFGYEVVGHVEVAPGLETWGMFRRSRP
jgi:GNAT superfamily N-acetyltransferase